MVIASRPHQVTVAPHSETYLALKAYAGNSLGGSYHHYLLRTNEAGHETRNASAICVDDGARSGPTDH